MHGCPAWDAPSCAGPPPGASAEQACCLPSATVQVLPPALGGGAAPPALPGRRAHRVRRRPAVRLAVRPRLPHLTAAAAAAAAIAAAAAAAAMAAAAMAGLLCAALPRPQPPHLTWLLPMAHRAPAGAPPTCSRAPARPSSCRHCASLPGCWRGTWARRWPWRGARRRCARGRTRCAASPAASTRTRVRARLAAAAGAERRGCCPCCCCLCTCKCHPLRSPGMPTLLLATLRALFDPQTPPWWWIPARTAGRCSMPTRREPWPPAAGRACRQAPPFGPSLTWLAAAAAQPVRTPAATAARAAAAAARPSPPATWCAWAPPLRSPASCGSRRTRRRRRPARSCPWVLATKPTAGAAWTRRWPGPALAAGGRSRRRSAAASTRPTQSRTCRCRQREQRSTSAWRPALPPAPAPAPPPAAALASAPQRLAMVPMMAAAAGCRAAGLPRCGRQQARWERRPAAGSLRSRRLRPAAAVAAAYPSASSQRRCMACSWGRCWASAPVAGAGCHWGCHCPALSHRCLIQSCI